MAVHRLDSDFLNFIVDQHLKAGDGLPALTELSQMLQINVGKLREQLEVARSLGLVEVRPRTGIRVKAYDFLPAIRLSLLFALALDKSALEQFTELRNHVEAAFLGEAAALLTDDDKAALRQLVEIAKSKLNHATMIQIPHAEHKQYHLMIFRNLENPFVTGLLEAYWEAYEAVELNAYADLSYWKEAWAYHERILDFICEGDFDAARLAFIEHTQLMRHRHEANKNHPDSDQLSAEMSVDNLSVNQRSQQFQDPRDGVQSNKLQSRIIVRPPSNYKGE
jgi:DNA-binding FadR family transcriptional regulator